MQILHSSGQRVEKLEAARAKLRKLAFVFKDT